MTSSVLDGAGCESPAPPAFSPLTDPADPGNREPSVNPTSALDCDADSAAPATSGDAPETPRRNGDAAGPAPGPPDPMDLDVSAMDGAVDYTTSPAPALDLYQQNPTQLLMALARLSAASRSQHMVMPPSTVRPSQVSRSLHPHTMLDSPDALQPATDAANPVPPADAPLESFARIEFADSVFQMTTYAVIIGRDQRALEQARRDERRFEEYQRRLRESEQLGLPAPSPPTRDRGKFSKSYVSEEGGMLGPESDGDDGPRPAKRRKTSGGAASGSGDSNPQETPAGEQAGQEEKNPTLNRQYVSHTPGAAAVNLSALRPSPYYVPFIGIHSPGPNIASRTKAISREHLKIEFNQKEGVFEAIPLHKNGFFCEDVHYKDEKVVLRSGDRLQIKDVDFVFTINGVPRGKTGAEESMKGEATSRRRYSEGGKEMSFEFESSHDPERRSTSPEEVSPQAAKDDSDSELSEPIDMPEPEPERPPEQEVLPTIEKDPEAQPAVKPEIPLELLADLPPIPKKRGPGRPPKNGIMSKREERLRKKAAMELAKKNQPQPPPGEPPVKRKVGRPRKHPLPENAPDRPEKRKYKPRKSKTGEEGGEGTDGEKTVKERRREKPKTPPLELNREDYTEEQLQKPNKNYGVLIDEVLSAAPGGLTLKQIYKRIQMKYPFYYFTVDTKGWESSVRHNLIGNDAFKKNEETHLWSRVPGIDIDAGKKRKATSPDQSTTMHNFGQFPPPNTPSTQMFHGEAAAQAYRSGSVPQRPGYHPGLGQAALGQFQQQQLGSQAAGAAAQQGPRQTYPSNSTQAPGAAPAAGYGDPATARPPQPNSQATAYASPYASRPPPAATAAAVQPSAVPQGAARQGVAGHHVPGATNGLPRNNGPTGQPGATGAAGVRPAQPTAVNGSTVTLQPAVAPELVKHVTNFKATVTEQLTRRTAAAEAVAMSVINRGLGLASESMVPDEEGLERIVLGVFESSRQKLGPNGSLHPELVQTLVKFKNSMNNTLEPRMGKLNAERLILSAVDRVLGFADRSTMPGTEAEKQQYDEAETVLIQAIKRTIADYQRKQAIANPAAVSSAAGPGGFVPTSSPAAHPGSAPMAPMAPNNAPPPGSAPATTTTTTCSATAPPNSLKPVQSMPVSVHHAQALARSSVPAPVSPATTQPSAAAASTQQAPIVTTNAQVPPRPSGTPASQAATAVTSSATSQPQMQSLQTAPVAGAQITSPTPNSGVPATATEHPTRAPAEGPAQLPAQTLVKVSTAPVGPIAPAVPAAAAPPNTAPAAPTAQVGPQTHSQPVTSLPPVTPATTEPVVPGAASVAPQIPPEGPTQTKLQTPAQSPPPGATQGSSRTTSRPQVSPAATQTSAQAALAAAQASAEPQVQTTSIMTPTSQARVDPPRKASEPVPASVPTTDTSHAPAPDTTQAQSAPAAQEQSQAPTPTPTPPAAPAANMGSVSTSVVPTPTPPPATATVGQ
ncbi:hypothetical protein VTK26DRAFT_558 [Humicola hyalothermophila]